MPVLLDAGKLERLWGAVPGLVDGHKSHIVHEHLADSGGLGDISGVAISVERKSRLFRV